VDPQRMRDVHDWRKYLLSDPNNAILDLARRRTWVPSWSMYEPSEVAAIIVRNLLENHPVVIALDGACRETLSVLELMLHSEIERKNKLSVAACICMLLSIIRRTVPRNTVLTLHENYVFWCDAFKDDVYDRGLDLRRDMWLTLALTQQLDGVAPRHLRDLFLTICEESGPSGSYPEYCIDAGFTGLRRLCVKYSADRVVDVTDGVRRWILKQKPTLEVAQRRWTSEMALLCLADESDPPLPPDIRRLLQL
jgi:hypothetical protein